MTEPARKHALGLIRLALFIVVTVVVCAAIVFGVMLVAGEVR